MSWIVFAFGVLIVSGLFKSNRKRKKNKKANELYKNIEKNKLLLLKYKCSKVGFGGCVLLEKYVKFEGWKEEKYFLEKKTNIWALYSLIFNLCFLSCELIFLFLFFLFTLPFDLYITSLIKSYWFNVMH